MIGGSLKGCLWVHLLLHVLKGGVGPPNQITGELKEGTDTQNHLWLLLCGLLTALVSETFQV